MMLSANLASMETSGDGLYNRWWIIGGHSWRKASNLHFIFRGILFLWRGLESMQFNPAETLAQNFQNPRAQALFGGLAAHSLLSFDQPLRFSRWVDPS